MEFPVVVNGTDKGSVILLEQPVVANLYMTLLGSMSVIGTVGNILILGTFLLTRTRKAAVGNIFFCNLAVSDMWVTAIINPFSIIGVWEGDHFYEDKPALCVILAGTCVVSCVVSLLSIGCISLNRYIYICHNSLYDKLYTKRNSIIMCIMTWIVGILLDMPSHVGWSRHTFDQKSHKCLFDRRYAYSYTVFFTVGGVMLPLVIITICYLKIFVHMGIVKKKIAKKTHHSNHSTLLKTIKQAKMMFVIFIVFAFCWLPYIVVLLLDQNDKYPTMVHLYCSLMAHCHASVNFIIYGISNKRIRLGYRKFISEKLLCNTCLVPSHSSSYVASEGRESDFITTRKLSQIPTPKLCTCYGRNVSHNDGHALTDSPNLKCQLHMKTPKDTSSAQSSFREGSAKKKVTIKENNEIKQADDNPETSCAGPEQTYPISSKCNEDGLIKKTEV